MKTKRIISIITIAACASFIGCAALQKLPETLGSPAQVQAQIVILGGLAKPYISAENQSKIHTWALQIRQTPNQTLDQLFALIPPTGSQNADALIAAAKAYLTTVVAKWGENNGTTLAYKYAVADGLLATFTVAEANRRAAYVAIAKRFNDRSRLVTTASTTSTKPWEPNRAFYVEKAD